MRLKNVESQLDEIYKLAPDAKVEIDNLASNIAAKFDGRVAQAPLKGRERALEKVMADYAGDASKIKDIARNTIIVKNGSIDDVARELEAAGASIKKITAGTNEMGYSGVNDTIKN